jgi:hypothetical protein
MISAVMRDLDSLVRTHGASSTLRVRAAASRQESEALSEEQLTPIADRAEKINLLGCGREARRIATMNIQFNDV